jgi:hypothetical protein
VYQNIYADGALVDTKLVDSSSIPQSLDWLWTKEIWTYAIWTEWSTADDLYDTTIVRDKWYLRIKARNFYISYVSYKLWTKLLLQNTEPMVEMLPWIWTSHY